MPGGTGGAVVMLFNITLAVLASVGIGLIAVAWLAW